MCGGTRPNQLGCVDIAGLSPRVRGNPAVWWKRWLASGSIPACAGEPRRRPASRCSTPVYPRVCGGTIATCPVCQRQTGLSPRVRGNRERPYVTDKSIGSIPACAGEPPPPAQNRCPHEVYPRVCGGTTTHYAALSAPSGLSPRVRGNPSTCSPGHPIPGSIPACAGEPPDDVGAQAAHQVYPRVCGGTTPYGGLAHQRQGLSPRVRGNLPHEYARWYSGRSIPACAGEPQPKRSATYGRWVYPRVCGGTPPAG